MSTPFTVEPELLHQGARQLDQAAATAEQASRKAREALGPSEAFGPSGYLRLSYALGDEDLATGVARLQDFLGKAK